AEFVHVGCSAGPRHKPWRISSDRPKVHYFAPMFTLLKLIQSIIKTLHSEGTPGQVAAGIALGAVLGLTPLMNVHNLIIFSLIVLLNVSFGGGMLGWALFVPIGFLLDPVFDRIGASLLQATSLLALLVLLAVLVILFAEPVARQTTEEVSTELLGTQVDVGRLDLIPKTASVDLGALQIADPFEPRRNLVEADRIVLKLNPEALT